MSHYHCEIVMPPTDDVNAAVASVMNPYDENYEDEDGEPGLHGFWDWWVIGGRWAGCKLQAGLSEEKVDAFYAELREKKFTVSGLQAGKPELQPASQIPEVDALWNERFPEWGGRACPLFNHFHNQYDKGVGAAGDVMPLGEVPGSLTCCRIIFAYLEDYSWMKDRSERKPPELKAKFMLQEDFWNGCNHQRTAWDMTLGNAREQYAKDLSYCKPEYAAKITPKDDWLVVTVDYHS